MSDGFMTYETYLRQQVDKGCYGVAIISAEIALDIANFIEKQRERIAEADRKTEPSNSEKPNNCETCRNKGFEGCEQPCLGCGCCDFYEPKDEPQTEDADCDKCIWSVCNYNKAFAFEDEPQTELVRVKYHCINCAENGSYKCSKCDGEMYYKYDKDEPQTDCAWK